MISSPALIILLRLLTAHLLADFFLQRYHWIVDKRTGAGSPYLYIHVLIVGGLTYLLLAEWSQWQLPLFIMITHFCIDWWKSTRVNCTRNFILDQLFHLLMILVGWLWYIGFNMQAAANWISSFNTISTWVIIVSYLAISRPAGFLIGKATTAWSKELADTPPSYRGLTDAGTWIGYLERFVILTLLLVGQYSAIGFLIAAKSIFRFNGQNDDDYARKQAEYILIGTFMSFLLAVAVGIMARYFLSL